MYQTALNIVRTEFRNVKDKGGNPYLEHLVSVSDRVPTIEGKIVGLLHDILEDSDYTSSRLRARGISERIITAVEILTRNEDETYKEFIDRIADSNNILAITVKISDLEDNMDLSRIKIPSKSDYNRVYKRYIPAYELLVEKLNVLKLSEN